MIRKTILLLGLAAVVAGCLPTVKSESFAPRLPKYIPEITGTPVPLTPTPNYQETPQAALDVGWPAPFTYGNPPTPPTPIPSPAPAQAFPRGVINIALLGSDRRPQSTSFRTDVIIVVSIHPRDGTVALLSIPRDLYVYLPGYSMQRINLAFRLGESLNYPGGGAALLADTIRYNFGIPIHHFAKVEMSGFSRIVDALGGVEVHVNCSYTDWRLRAPGLNQEDERNWRLYTVNPGVVEMDGDLALWYARSRRRSSDFDRSRRQQEVLRALYRQILQLDLITRIPDVYGELRDTVTTDIDLSTLLSLAPLATRIGTADIRSRFIGRDEVTSWRVPSSGAQVLVPKAGPIQALVSDTFDFSEPDELIPAAALAVEVLNASGRTDWGDLAAERLNYAGFQAYVGAIEPSDDPSTYLIDFGVTPSEASQQILEAFGLSDARLVHLPDASSPFAFRLVVGTDYKPCFNPTRDQLG
jgi:LCP family protein required for cell wall assembly